MQWGRSEFFVNFDRTWRDRVGGWLRKVADRVDGRSSLALWVASNPPVKREIVYSALSIGLHNACDLFEHELHEAMFDEALRDLRPERAGGADPAGDERRDQGGKKGAA